MCEGMGKGEENKGGKLERRERVQEHTAFVRLDDYTLRSFSL